MMWGIEASPVAQREYLADMKKMELAAKERKEQKRNKSISSTTSSASTRSSLSSASSLKKPSNELSSKNTARKDKLRFFEALTTVLPLK